MKSPWMKRTRKRIDKPIPLGRILGEALRASQINVDLELYRLWEEWSDLVGPAIAQNAWPEGIKGKLLLVNVSSSPWMQQLQYLKSELMEKLNTALGKKAVEDIRFKVGPVNPDAGKVDDAVGPRRQG